MECNQKKAVCYRLDSLYKGDFRKHGCTAFINVAGSKAYSLYRLGLEATCDRSESKAIDAPRRKGLQWPRVSKGSPSPSYFWSDGDRSR